MQRIKYDLCLEVIQYDAKDGSQRLSVTVSDRRQGWNKAQCTVVLVEGTTVEECIKEDDLIQRAFETYLKATAGVENVSQPDSYDLHD